MTNTGSGDLTLANGRNQFGIQVTAGDGDIEITNDAGDLLVQTAVQTKPIPTPIPGGDPIDNGPGGDITFTVNPGNQVVLDPRLLVSRSSLVSIASGRKQTYEGDVELARNIAIAANGGVAVVGALDSQDAATPRSLTATIADGTAFAVRDGAGAQRPLSALTLSSTLVGTDDGPLVLDTPTVVTSGSQTYRADLSLAQQTSLTGGAVEFGGEKTSAAAGVAVNAADEVLFSAAGDQSVVATAGNLIFAGRASVPIDASIAKPTGNLTLTSREGSLILGDREKLSAGGSLALAGRNTVRFTDLSALDIAVTSPDIQIFSRESGPVVLPDRAVFTDGGTDVLANTVSFSSAPVAVGSGPAPRIATLSGAAQNAGAIPVTRLPAPVSLSSIANGSRAFDLAIPSVDPGHETQEIATRALVPPLAPQASGDQAVPGEPVSSEEVVAFLACAPLGEEFAPTGCGETVQPAYGSALDTERAVEVARAYRTLLGDTPPEMAGREALARAAADPKAEIGSASSPAGRDYLTEVARVLGQVRLLGLGDGYREVRADLLAAVARAIGSPQLDAARLGAAVDARAMGMPI